VGYRMHGQYAGETGMQVICADWQPMQEAVVREAIHVYEHQQT